MRCPRCKREDCGVKLKAFKGLGEIKSRTNRDRGGFGGGSRLGHDVKKKNSARWQVGSRGQRQKERERRARSLASPGRRKGPAGQRKKRGREGRGERAQAFWWAETELGRGVGWLRPAGGRPWPGSRGLSPSNLLFIFFFFPKHFLNRILCTNYFYPRTIKQNIKYAPAWMHHQDY